MNRLNNMGDQAQKDFSAHMGMITENNDRGAYNQLVQQQKAGKISGNALITEGYLRSEANLGATNRVSFDLVQNQGSAQNVTEKRLQISDCFVMTHLSLLLYTGSVDQIPTQEERASAQLFSFPSDRINGSGNINAVYNSFLQIRVNQTVFFDRFDTLNFLRVGTAQAGLVAPAYTSSTWDTRYWAFAPIVPFITFGGQDSNDVSLNLPQGVDLSANFATAVFFARGLLVQNAYN